MTENTEEGPIQSESEQEYASCSFEQGNSYPEQEVLMGMNPAEKKGNIIGTRPRMSKGKKTWVPLPCL